MYQLDQRQERRPGAKPINPKAKNESMEGDYLLRRFYWARDHHDVVIVDRRGQIVAILKSSTRRRLATLRPASGALGAENLAVCVETSQGLVIEQLLESGVSLYPIPPVSSKAYRERKAPSGPRAIRSMPVVWQPCVWMSTVESSGQRVSPDCRVAAALPRRSRLDRGAHRLGQPAPERSARILSAALEAFEDWTLPAAWAFVELFPNPARLWPPANANGKSSSTFTSWRGRKPMPSACRSSRPAASSPPRIAHPQQEPASAGPHPDAAGAPNPDRGLSCRDREALCYTPITNSSVLPQQAEIAPPLLGEMAPIAPALMIPALYRLWP